MKARCNCRLTIRCVLWSVTDSTNFIVQDTWTYSKNTFTYFLELYEIPFVIFKCLLMETAKQDFQCYPRRAERGIVSIYRVSSSLYPFPTRDSVRIRSLTMRVVTGTQPRSHAASSRFDGTRTLCLGLANEQQLFSFNDDERKRERKRRRKRLL